MSRLSTPRAAAVAGVLFALLFATALVLIRLALPEGAEPGAQWLVSGSTNLKVAATIMPFAGIAFLWFIGVVRDGFGGFEDKFFSTVFIGSGLLFLAMMFVAAGVGAGLERSHAAGRPISRTAFLHVDYRKVTPIDTPLIARGWVGETEGRKAFVNAELRDPEENLLAEANGLMIRLLPGQP